MVNKTPYQFFPCYFYERMESAPNTFWLLVLTTFV